MSFLPFVLSFLLILILGSSVLFTSFRSTYREKTIILAQKSARLSLISNQNLEEFNALKKAKQKAEKPLPARTKKNAPTASQEKGPFRNRRSERTALPSSKFNLWPLVHDPNTLVSNVLYEKAIRLLQILYQDTDFYKATQDKELARKIVDELCGKKKESLMELFPQDPLLSEVYYKMLKGTNTAYPALEEYFKLEDCTGKPPLNFPYASTPVLRAVLGEALTERIYLAEKAKAEKSSKSPLLSAEELHELLSRHPSSAFDINHLKQIFSFNRKNKGLPQVYVDEKHRVMAKR